MVATLVTGVSSCALASFSHLRKKARAAVFEVKSQKLWKASLTPHALVTFRSFFRSSLKHCFSSSFQLSGFFKKRYFRPVSQSCEDDGSSAFSCLRTVSTASL